MYISPVFLQLSALIWIKRLLDAMFLFCAFYLITDILHFFVGVGVIVTYFLVGLLAEILVSQMNQEQAEQAMQEYYETMHSSRHESNEEIPAEDVNKDKDI